MRLEHLGMSGLRLGVDGLVLHIDPPAPVQGPVALTWSERERVAGAASASSLAAPAALLRWLGRDGTALPHGRPVAFEGFVLTAFPYAPIPYATAVEAMRKTRSALRSPSLAVQRLAHTLRRPRCSPVALLVQSPSRRVGFLQQSLHRFLGPEQLDSLVAQFGALDLLVAGTDFDDERATGRLMGAFSSRHFVIADLIGPVRRRLGLPTRPLALTLEMAPAGTVPLEEGGSVGPLAAPAPRG